MLTMTDVDSLLRVTGVRKSFGGVEVLHGVDLHLSSGETLALLGENGAGKSTLVKIIAGDHTADAGSISLAGQEVGTLDPVKARRLGIRMIFQELSDAGPLTVAENIFLGRYAARSGIVSWSEMKRRAQVVLDELEADFDASRKVESLRVGERQLVEIARALSDEARILILDEPTAALSSSEVQKLFSAIRRLRTLGVGMVYITHRLDEVAEIADRVQVLRDGASALDRPVAEVTRPEMVTAMIGRSAQTVRRPVPSEHPSDSVALGVRGLTSDGFYTDIDFDVHLGEVVALYGKVGSGTAEIAESLFGLHRTTAGTVTIAGGTYQPKSPADAVGRGIGFLPADRQRSGTLAVRPVAENLAAPSWRRMSTVGIIRRSTEAAAYATWQKALAIRSRRDPMQPIGTLSGGNQQKVLLARWFERGARVLILIEPTRGVDVGAREDIYRTLRDKAANEGLAVLVATSDYEEVVQLADRALVVGKGHIVEMLDGDLVTATALTTAAGG
jgi:ribose transport system ATP-binding protein